jgi:Xaa-Pro aminopeptidase
MRRCAAIPAKILEFSLACGGMDASVANASAVAGFAGFYRPSSGRKHIGMNYATRQQKLAWQLLQSGVDGLLITHLPNVHYLCGFNGSAGVLLLKTGKHKPRATFYTDGRYTQQAVDQVRSASVVIGKKSPLMEAVGRLQKGQFRTLGFESHHLSYGEYTEIAKVVRGKTKLQAIAGPIEELRSVKDGEEIEQIRAAALLGASLFPTATSVIAPGITENHVAGELELQARRAGADGMSFETIVAAGARSALPHGRASAQAIPASGFVILDYGVILAGYCSDMTRTVHVGRASKTHRRMYEAVHEAQLASIGAVRPGVEAREVDEAGRTLLKKAGYGAYFTHSTGHGVGIEVHERPRLAKGQAQKLAPGMVVTIEPGIYVPAEGGVRIEDMVLVTESGHEILTPTTKDLIEL